MRCVCVWERVYQPKINLTQAVTSLITLTIAVTSLALSADMLTMLGTAQQPPVPRVISPELLIHANFWAPKQKHYFETFFWLCPEITDRVEVILSK